MSPGESNFVQHLGNGGAGKVDPAHLRLILGIIVIALALSRAVEHHAAGLGLLLMAAYGEEGLSRGNIQKLIVSAALRSLGHHDALAQQPVDPTAADKKGLIQDDNFIIRFSDISGVGIHGREGSFQFIVNRKGFCFRHSLQELLYHFVHVLCNTGYRNPGAFFL